MEYERNTGDFYMTNEQMAKMFGVSEKTISRTLGTLENRNIITRDTKNVKGGKERHIHIKSDTIEKLLKKQQRTK